MVGGRWWSVVLVVVVVVVGGGWRVVCCGWVCKCTVRTVTATPVYRTPPLRLSLARVGHGTASLVVKHALPTAAPRTVG